MTHGQFLVLLPELQMDKLSRLPTRMDFTMITYQGHMVMDDLIWIMPIPNDEHCGLHISDVYEVPLSEYELPT